jgi:hypothetical protein
LQETKPLPGTIGGWEQWKQQLRGMGVAGASRPAPSIPAETAGESKTPIAASTELRPGGRTFELTGGISRPGAFEAAGC